MPTDDRDAIPLSQANTQPSELAARAKAGARMILTPRGKHDAALDDIESVDRAQRLEPEQTHVQLILEASQGLADVVAGRVKEAPSALAALRSRRRASRVG